VVCVCVWCLCGVCVCLCGVCVCVCVFMELLKHPFSVLVIPIMNFQNTD